MVIVEGKRDKEQKIALIKLVWGCAVSIAGIIGLLSHSIPLLIVGAVLDSIDSIIMGLGGIFSSIFFAFAGTLILFFCAQAPWWQGLCTGLCVEGVLGGILAYSWRIARFVSEEKGPFVRRLKRAIRRFLEEL